MHDSTILEPTYEESFTLLREVHDPTRTDPSHDEIFALSNHLGELVHSPISYTFIFCSIHLNEVWVKGLFFIVPHEEYGIYISPYIIYICSHILCYIMMIHIYMDAPMMFT